MMLEMVAVGAMAQGFPVHGRAAVDFDVTAAFFGQEVQ
jgi:hypothetical protein